MEQVTSPHEEKKPMKKFGRFLLKLLILLLETVLLLLIVLYGVLYVVAKGPSPTASTLFVRSVRETSAIGFLADLFFTEDEIYKMEHPTEMEEYTASMDPSLIIIPSATEPADESNGPQPDEWGFIDEDGDGIIIEPVKGQGYSGLMMIVKDPSRVILATKPECYNKQSFTVAEMVAEFDGVAGINAGGFYDPDGYGDGSTPDTMVFSDGEVYFSYLGSSSGFAGFDSNHILHVGRFSAEEAKARDIQCGVGFGPVLISNGVPQDNLSSGLNPRTGIGQRSDGAVLLLVIDGRQVTSIGATYADMADVFMAFGAVNACNMDGGSSTVMYYEGEYINHCASVVGIRPVPTAFVVLKEGESGND